MGALTTGTTRATGDPGATKGTAFTTGKGAVRAGSGTGMGDATVGCATSGKGSGADAESAGADNEGADNEGAKSGGADNEGAVTEGAGTEGAGTEGGGIEGGGIGARAMPCAGPIPAGGTATLAQQP